MRRAFVNLRGNSLPVDVTGRLLLLSRLVWPAERTTWEPDQRATTLENLDGSTLTMHDADRVNLGGVRDNVTLTKVAVAVTTRANRELVYRGPGRSNLWDDLGYLGSVWMLAALSVDPPAGNPSKRIADKCARLYRLAKHGSTAHRARDLRNSCYR